MKLKFYEKKIQEYTEEIIKHEWNIDNYDILFSYCNEIMKNILELNKEMKKKEKKCS